MVGDVNTFQNCQYLLEINMNIEDLINMIKMKHQTQIYNVGICVYRHTESHIATNEYIYLID